jgi:hypothetical protein
MLSRLRANGRQQRSEMLSRRAGLRRHRAYLQLYVPHLQEWTEWFAALVAELQDCCLCSPDAFGIFDVVVVRYHVIAVLLSIVERLSSW